LIKKIKKRQKGPVGIAAKRGDFITNIHPAPPQKKKINKKTSI